MDCNKELLKKKLASSQVSVRDYAALADVWEQDLGQGLEPFRGICIVLRGAAQVLRKNETGTMLMSKLTVGDVFGAATIQNDENFFAPHIVCKTKLSVLAIPEQLWLDWLHEDFALMNSYLHYVNARLQFLNRRLDALSQDSVENRVLSFVRSSAIQGKYKVDSYTELAMMLCVGRVSLYRAFDALEDKGKMTRENKTIILKG